MLNTFKILGCISATAKVAPQLIQTLEILPDSTVKRSIVDTDDLKYTGNQKRGQISQGDEQAYYYSQIFQIIYITS